MKEQVLTFLRRNPEHKFNTRQLARKLELHSSEHKALRTALKDLLHEGKVIVDRNQRYAMRDEARVLKGSMRVHADGYGFFIPESSKKDDVFIPQKHMNGAMNNDEVLVESFRSRGNRYEGRILRILKRAQAQVVGTIEKKGSQHFAILRDGKLGVREIYVPKKNLGKARVGDLVGLNIVQFPGPGIMCIGEVDHVIGLEDDLGSLTEGILYQHGIRQQFSSRIKQKMERLPQNPPEELKEGRVDLRHIPFMTIDGITARDFDDAVCVQKKGKGFILYVAIADVSEYVTRGSDLDKEALMRGNSTYLPDRCIPMLPEKLSNGLCSLNPNVPRYTMTAEIHYNANFDFSHARIYKSLIQSQKRATYNEVEAYFDGTGGKEFTKELRTSLDLMKELSGALMKKSSARGTLGFDLPEAEVIFDGHGNVINIQKKQRLYSHKLIEEFMIAANVVVAKYFSSRRVPAPYRVHDQPDSTKVQDFMATVHNLGLGKHLEGFEPAAFFERTKDHPLASHLQFAFLRSLKQAIYSPDNIGHFGLQLEDYAHFTSPIRRYPDLIVHRQLKSLMAQDDDGILEFEMADFNKEVGRRDFEIAHDYDDLEKMTRQCSERERKSMEAEREVLSLTKVQFFKDHLFERILGMVTRVSKYGLTLLLDPFFVEGTLPFVEMKDDYYDLDERKMRLVGRRTKRIIKVGDRIAVQAVQADLESNQIVLQAIEQKSPKKPKSSKKKSSRKKSKSRKTRKR